MPSFRYSAKTMDGRSSHGVVEAESRDVAVAILMEKGLYAHKITEERVAGSDSGSVWGAQSRGASAAVSAGGVFSFVTLAELALVTRELAAAVGAGLTIDHALEAVREGRLSMLMRSAINGISDDVKNGKTISDALARHPRVFNRMYRGMVLVGERSGTLDVVLANLATFFENEVELRRRIQAAFIYPSITFGVAILAAFILACLGFIQSGIYRMLIAALIAIASIWLAGKNRHISSIFRSLLSRLPVIGTLIRQISVARVCLALGTALKSGVPFLEAVSLAREAAYLSEVEGAMDRVYRDLSHGMPISESLSRQRIFPHVVRNLVGAGEQTGGIDAMLFKAYEYMMSDINYRVRGLASLAGPLATIIVGGIVLLIAVQFLGGYFNMIFQAVGN